MRKRVNWIVFLLVIIGGLGVGGGPIRAQEAEEVALTGPEAPAENISEEGESEEAIVIEKKEETGEEEGGSADKILDNLERLAKDPDASEQIKDQYDEAAAKNRGFVAVVLASKDGALRVNVLGLDGETEEVFITPDKSTTIIKKGQSTSGENLEMDEWFAIDEYLVVIGVQDGETFSPRRILVSSEEIVPVEEFLLRGSVERISSSSVTIVKAGGTEEQNSYTIDKAVKILSRDGVEIEASEIETESNVLLVGTIDNDGDEQLQTIRVL